VPILCYEITGSSSPNERSTTGAENGHVGAVLKGDHQAASGQLYSEMAANRLAMFLGIPVIVGVPARRGQAEGSLRFAALRAAEAGLDLYDFTDDDRDNPDNPDNPDNAPLLPEGIYRTAGHVRATAALCAKYPLEAAAKEKGLTVSFDGNFRSTLWSWEEARDFCTECLPYVDVLLGIEPYHLWKDENDHSKGDWKDGVPLQPSYEQQDELPGTQQVRVWGDTAVVTALLWCKGTAGDGKPFDYKVWFSDTYVRTPAGWKYVFGQASLPLPPENK